MAIMQDDFFSDKGSLIPGELYSFKQHIVGVWGGSSQGVSSTPGVMVCMIGL